VLLIWKSFTASIAVYFITRRKFVKFAGRWQIRKFGLKFIGSDVKECKGEVFKGWESALRNIL
jgi:hypothetical protein